MAISFVEGVQASGLSATLSAAPPSGSLLIAVNTNQSSDAGVATGWTQLDVINASTWDTVTAWKICGASESATQTPFTGTTGNVSITRFDSTTGFPASPIDVHNAAQGTTATPPSQTSGSLTPTTANNAVFLQCYASSNSDTPPASVTGMTTIISSLNVGATGRGMNAYQIGIGTSAFTKTCTFTGTASATPYVTVIVIKENASSGRTASLSVTLANVTDSATATNLDHATLTQTLGAATVSAAATNLDHAGVTKTLGNVTETAAATNLDHAALSKTLGAVTATSAATNVDHAALSQTLGPITEASAATNLDHSALSKTLGAATISATAVVGAVAQAQLNLTLANVGETAAATNLDHAHLSAGLSVNLAATATNNTGADTAQLQTTLQGLLPHLPSPSLTFFRGDPQQVAVVTGTPPYTILTPPDPHLVSLAAVDPQSGRVAVQANYGSLYAYLQNGGSNTPGEIQPLTTRMVVGDSSGRSAVVPIVITPTLHPGGVPGIVWGGIA